MKQVIEINANLNNENYFSFIEEFIALSVKFDIDVKFQGSENDKTNSDFFLKEILSKSDEYAKNELQINKKPDLNDHQFKDFSSLKKDFTAGSSMVIKHLNKMDKIPETRDISMAARIYSFQKLNINSIMDLGKNTEVYEDTVKSFLDGANFVIQNEDTFK